jgi:hypothetical protein
MKMIFYGVLFCLIATAGQCQAPDVTRVEFTTMTRGYQKQVFLSQDSLISIIDGRQQENKVAKRKLSDGEWDLITASVQEIRLADINSLKSPTSRRTYDAARHSTIKLTTKDGQGAEHSFDDESPNPKLKALMEAILKIDTGSSQK